MTAPTPGGPMAWMARNSVAANLLLAAIVLAGLVGLSRVRWEVYPEFDLDLVTIAVPYPAASPEEVEASVLLPIEDALGGVDGVERVTSVAGEGIGKIGVELLLGADRQAVLAEVEAAVNRVRSLPDEAGEPVVALAARHREVVSLVVYGDELDQGDLYALGEKIRVELPVTQAEVLGVPSPEIAIEVPLETLVAHGLTTEQLARQIRAASIALPAGSIRTTSGEVLVRFDDRRLTARQLAALPVVASGTGARLTLGDIATLTDGFAQTDQASYFNGHPAVQVTAYRVGDETPQSVAATVLAYADALRAELPADVGVTTWRDDSKQLRDRVDLLVRNGISGFVLVLLVLAAFLQLRLAFWVGLGIPVSFLGAFLLMPGFDLSINMITLFAFIVTLGMVVDDAIVIGESVHGRREAGLPFLQAAIEGSREVAVPVVFSTLTTVVAFLPLLLVPGVMGKLFSSIPIIVIGVLGVSLIESLFILPAHLAHMKASKGPGRISVWTERFVAHRFTPFLRRLMGLRYVVVGSAVAMLILTLGAVASGLVPFTFFPVLQGDVIGAYATLPYGTPVERTLRVREQLEQALHDAVAELGDPGIVQGVFTRVGQGPRTGGYGQRHRDAGSHLLSIEVELVSANDRDVMAEQVAGAWRAHTPPLAGLETLVITAAAGPSAGRAVDVQLTHPDPEVLTRASEEVRQALTSYASLTNVQSSVAGGKPQLSYAMRPDGLELGLVGTDVARQVRGALYGAEALRAHRGGDEVRVMVRLPEDQRRQEHRLETFRVRSPAGAWVPLAEVAQDSRGRAPAEIQRESGRRVVDVSAERQPGVASTGDVVDSLQSEVLPSVVAAHPGLAAELVGEQREQREVLTSIFTNYAVALFLVYALLAIPFRSYTQPLIIMSAIPFGLIGAVVGHLVMGYELSASSTMGMVALSGVVVNDSLVLIDAANRLRRGGSSAEDAIVQGAARRFRPILLTSLTTFVGLLPMMAETSVQARFLVPMALSLGFGVLFATALILIVVPALFLILDDCWRLVGPHRTPAS